MRELGWKHQVRYGGEQEKRLEQSKGGELEVLGALISREQVRGGR